MSPDSDIPGVTTTTSTADGERPLRADARRNRERIIDAARATFGEFGAAAQMDEIAQRAGVGIGTLYRHFPTKEALIGALMSAKLLEIAARARAWHDRTGDPWEDFAGFVRDNTEAMAKDAAQQRMLWDYSPATVPVGVEAAEAIAEATGYLVARAQEAGALRADFDQWDLPTLMCSLGASMDRQLPGHNDWRRIREIVLDGLRAGAANT